MQPIVGDMGRAGARSPAHAVRRRAELTIERLRPIAVATVGVARSVWERLRPWWVEGMLAAGFLACGLLAAYLLIYGQ